MTDEFDNDGMPPGWKTGPSLLSKGKFHDRVVDDFLRVVRWAQNDPARLMAQGKRDDLLLHAYGGGTDTASRKFSNRLHYRLRELIRDARIFEIVPDLFIRVDHEADVYITETLAGVPHKPAIFGDTPWGKVQRRPEISGEELIKYSQACRRYSAEIGVPNPRPFNVMWLGMGSLITLSSRLWAIQDSTLTNAGTELVTAPAIVGILISDEFCCEVNTCTLNIRGEEAESIMLIPLWVNDMWLSPELGHPWTLNAIVEILNQQDTLITEAPIIDKRKFSQRRWWQQQMKKKEITGKIAVIPPMYYTVTITPTTYTEKTKLAMQSARNWTHRWDVRGHPMTKATAGTKPIHPVVRRSLLARGYTIIENPDDLTDEQAAVLTRHKKSFPSNAIWVAVKIGWRKAFVKGPAEKPYIPAVWKLKDERGRGE